MSSPLQGLDLPALKDRVVEGSERRLVFYNDADLSRHFANLRGEFVGFPEICLVHAQIISKIRRKIDLVGSVPAFFALWEHEAEFLGAHLDSKWLISACETFADHGTPLQRRTAMVISAITTMMQLCEGERLTLRDPSVDPAKTERVSALHRAGEHIALWDGVRFSNQTRGGVRPHLLLRRVAELVAAEPALDIIARTVIARALDADTLFGRLSRLRPDFLPAELRPEPEPYVPPILVGARHGFSVVAFKKRYFGVPHSLGPVDLEKAEIDRLPGLLVSDSIMDLLGRIDAVNDAALFDTPVLIETAGAFNIVRYRGRYLGVPHALGPLDLRQHDLAKLQGLIDAGTLDAARRGIRDGENMR